MFTLNIKTDNDAFSDDRRAEIARILRETANKLETRVIFEGSSFTLRDVNGNDVGRAKLGVQA